MKTRRGTTLIELVVVIAIMGILTSVVALSLRPQPARAPQSADRIVAARRLALVERRPVTIDVVVGEDVFPITAFPDGSVIADSSLRVNRLTGERSNAQ